MVKFLRDKYSFIRPITIKVVNAKWIANKSLSIISVNSNILNKALDTIPGDKFGIKPLLNTIMLGKKPTQKCLFRIVTNSLSRDSLNIYYHLNNII